ncbi:MAG: adenylate/guanylate cyclase domain-containing protein [Treponema sp.]|nr:adenylate/guanylate cyclase domain-containing protein [Treponema sp.]
MSKRILVLEPSITTQSFMKDKLKKTDIVPVFETNGIKMLVSMYNTLPAAVIINARNMNPKSTELVRLIKSVDKVKKIPIGVYSTSDFSFEKHYMQNTGADSFIHLEKDDFVVKMNELINMGIENKVAGPMQNDLLKSGIAQKIFEYMHNLENLDKLAGNFLNLLMEFCEVPAVSLYINEDDGVEVFYICSKNFTESELNDFLKICTSDFEEIFPDTNILKVTPQQIEALHPIEKYHTGDIPLSAFQSFPLITSSKVNVGTVNTVKEGSFTTYQIDLMRFAVDLFGMLIENSISLKKKLKFELNVRKAFSRFVPEQIIDDLVNKASQSEDVTMGEKRDIAILFSDIRSFTSISEINKPETIVAFLNRYFTTMTTIIKKHGGTVDKFIGDAIMALFGAPKSYEDNCRRAVAAAYEMREALETIPLEDLVLPDGMKFNIGIGIHYGDVIVGSIGSNDKTDYSVIGDNVNLASRMEGLTKNYGSMILVTEAVKKDIYKTCGDDLGGFIFRYLDDVKVKGKEKAVPIYGIDRSLEEFSPQFRDYYTKGFELYKQGTWNLAREYFDKALSEIPEDKAARLMLDRCIEFIQNPPENWDGAITYHTK